MAYSNDGRRTTTRRSQGRVGESRGQGTVTSRPSRPAQARGGSPSQYRNARGYRTGSYDLRQHNIRFNNRRGGLLGQSSYNPRAIAAFIAGFVLLVICVFGITTVVRGCVANRKQQAPANQQDSRVAGGISDDMTSSFTQALDRGEALAAIAAGADKVPDDRLLTLALNEPDAASFVLAYVNDSVPNGAKHYDNDVSRGVYPVLYDWDPRWGYVSYGNGPMAVTGSGPTSLAMAYFGLLGKSDKGPADFAAIASETGGTSETFGTTANFFVSHAEELGLELHDYSPDGETLNDVLDSGIVVLVQLKEGTFGERGHWALAVSENLDGSINLYDPTSSSNTKHPWDPATIAANSETFLSLSRAREDDD